ncbi:MAG: SpoIIE family protein phosphatase [Flavobacteriales bacterium]|nr:SpoIIE family protein phosphatase [Flavobacteriales bacterium]
MELTIGLTMVALPALFLGASVGLSLAYNRLQARYARIERDRDSYLGVLEGSNDALFVINFVNGRIYQANEKAAEMLGYTREQLAKLSIFEIHPRAFLDRSATRIAEAWEQKGAVYEDIPLLTAKGVTIDVESSVRVTSYRGDPAVILFARDIRSRLALQRQVNTQQALVREQNQQLLSSIRYAQRIQRAVLPESEQLQELLPDSFILFRPRDIVSGDLYWFAEKKGKVVVAAADCTGHGVPGALLSLIGASLFQEMVMEKGILCPGAILDGARTGMIHALSKQDGSSDNRDGMNAGVLVLDRHAGTMAYAGGFSPLYRMRDGELNEYKGDRMPIGQQEGANSSFTPVVIPVLPGDRFFLFTDGLQDQFGGPQGKKLKSSGLKDWITGTSLLPIDDQYQAISDKFRSWKGDEEQVDDILLIGLQV